MISALLDANVYISYLLTRRVDTPPARIVDVGLDGEFEIVLASEVIAEVRRKTTTKPYLARHIAQAEVDHLVRSLYIVARLEPDVDPPVPEIGPDRKDDYLFAHALLGRTDYLVSGDRGVQKVEKIGDVRIMSPAAFLDTLRPSGRLS